MKLDICEKTYTQKELCSEVTYCCNMMKSMVKQYHIDIDIHEYGPDVKLRLDPDSYGMHMGFVRRQEDDEVYIGSFININYCPFCGEKIE